MWTFVSASNVKGFGSIGAIGCAIGGVVVGMLVASYIGIPYSYGLIRSLQERAEEQAGDHGVLVVLFRF